MLFYSLLLLILSPFLRAQPLAVSVYATAGGVRQHLATPAARQQAAEVLRRFGVTRIYLEGRRGDEYVPPELLIAARDQFRQLGIQPVGAIATVAGKKFGTQENSPFVWLNWESPATREAIRSYFRENAAIFDEITIDDFYCTNDTTPASVAAKGSRDWGQYRRDLLTSLLEPLVFAAAREANANVKLILKYPQWYDKFHQFGYDPARMSPRFSRLWVGTEVRNPETRRMGFTQPTMGYINFRWLSSIAGAPVHGAWFDHIECTAQNFADQAWQSVLAGAAELTLFNLIDVLNGHPGHELFLRGLPQMRALSDQVRGKPARGIAYYKPSGSESDGDMFLMDYLAMLGLPIVPVSQYPRDAKVAILGVQAAADPGLVQSMQTSLRNGATLVCTPALLRKLGAAGAKLAPAVPAEAYALSPAKRSGRGRVFTWNVSAFSDASYEGTGERLLPPTKLDLVNISQPAIDAIRKQLLAPVGVSLSAPPRVALYLIGGKSYAYNFRNDAAAIVWNGRRMTVPANQIAMLP